MVRDNRKSKEFLDPRKAFYTVSQELLLMMRPSCCGVRGKALNLFKSYLSDIVQRARFNEQLSNELDIELKWITRIVLGPIRLQLYINPLRNSDVNGTHVVFTDDTVLLFSGPDWWATRMTGRGGGGLKRVNIWLNRNLLSLNIEKTETHFICFPPNVTGHGSTTNGSPLNWRIDAIARK